MMSRCLEDLLSLQQTMEMKPLASCRQCHADWLLSGMGIASALSLCLYAALSTWEQSP